MLKVLKNLKKSFWQVLVIVILLCIQATTDLALPDYTSKIINIGIQSGGIETTIPEMIAKEDMETLLIFTKEEDNILDYYTLVGENFTKQEEKTIHQYIGKDKKIEPNTIYLLKEGIEEDKKSELSKKIAGPLIEVTMLQKEEIQTQIKEQIIANVVPEQQQYIQSQNLIEIIKTLPEESKEQMIKEFTKKTDEMQESIKEQATMGAVKEIYKNLGVDTNKLQNDYILMTGLQMLRNSCNNYDSSSYHYVVIFSSSSEIRKNIKRQSFQKSNPFFQ